MCYSWHRCGGLATTPVSQQPGLESTSCPAGSHPKLFRSPGLTSAGNGSPPQRVNDSSQRHNEGRGPRAIEGLRCFVSLLPARHRSPRVRPRKKAQVVMLSLSKHLSTLLEFVRAARCSASAAMPRLPEVVPEFVMVSLSNHLCTPLAVREGRCEWPYSAHRASAVRRCA